MKKILFLSVRNLQDYVGRPHYLIRRLAREFRVVVFNSPQPWKRRFREPLDEYEPFFSENVSVVNGYPIGVTEPLASELLNAPHNLSSLRRLVRREGFSLIVNNGHLLPGALARMWTRGVPMILEVVDFLPGAVSSVRSPTAFPLKRLLAGGMRRLLDRSIANSDVVTVVSRKLADYAIHAGAGEVELLPNGVCFSGNEMDDGSRQRIRRRLGIGEEDVTLGYLGAITRLVRLDIVLTWLARAKRAGREVRLIVAGDGPALAEYKAIASSLAVEGAVAFLGRVSHEDRFQYISAMDVCLIPFVPDPWSEGSCPLKLFEYLACMKPVVTSGVPEANRIFPTDMFSPAVTNLDAITEEALEKAVSDAVAGAESQRMRDALNTAARVVQEGYAWNSIGDRFTEIARRLIEHPP